jgi:diguanylate cyclase (GGDEF)-like protein
MFSRLLTAGHLSIKMKLIITLTIILLSGIVLSNYFNYKTSQNSVRENLLNGILPLTSDNIYTEIQTHLIRPVFLSSVMANDTFLKDWAISGEKDSSKIINYLKTIKNKYEFFSTFFVSEITKKYYHHNGIAKTISKNDSHDQWYFKFVDSGLEYDLDVDTNEAENNILTIFINHRTTDYKDNLIGVTGVGLKMDKITSLLRSYKDSYGSVVYLVDTSGIIQAHPNEKLTEHADIHKLKGIKDIADVILNSKESTAMYEFNRNSEHVLLSVRYIPEFNWFLFVEIDENSRMGNITKNITLNFIFGFLFSISIIGICIFVVNYYQSRLEYMAMTDELTGANNRREFDMQFRKSVYDYNRSGIPFSLIIFDIDHFKNINDTMGHITGDSSIKTIASIARSCLRLTDILVRWGGDEFIILTRGDEESAFFAADRIRKQVETSEFFKKHDDRDDEKSDITISCGVSGFRKGDTLDSILARADAALYRAKTEGRNRIYRG